MTFARLVTVIFSVNKNSAKKKQQNLLANTYNQNRTQEKCKNSLKRERKSKIIK